MGDADAHVAVALLSGSALGAGRLSPRSLDRSPTRRTTKEPAAGGSLGVRKGSPAKGGHAASPADEPPALSRPAPTSTSPAGEAPAGSRPSSTSQQHASPAASPPGSKHPRLDFGAWSTSNPLDPALQATLLPLLPPSKRARGIAPAASAPPQKGDLDDAGGAGDSEGAGAGAPQPSAPKPLGWTAFPVTEPTVNWAEAFGAAPQRFQTLARGYEKMDMAQGLVSYVVSSGQHAEDAVRRLRDSMQDPVIAIDCEWRPEFTRGQSNPVAMLQLSSATTCLLLRTCCTAYALPRAVARFLADPSIVVLGCGWGSGDEAKMVQTFGEGKSRFRSFLDLQNIASSLGYRKVGLSSLSEEVLGVALKKSKSATMSNWAAPALTSSQLKYASLDVLAAGNIFRALRRLRA